MRQPKKVPVFIYVYRTLPREALEVNFTTPQGSSRSQPYVVNEDSRLGWRVSRKSEEVVPDSLMLTHTGTMASVDVTSKKGGKIGDFFNRLGRGVHELTLKATYEGDSRSTSAFVTIAPGAPQVRFRDLFDGRDEAEKALEFPESAELLEQEIPLALGVCREGFGRP